jgi:branched-chain amino acid transport system permease protein
VINSRQINLTPTPAELAALFGAGYFLWFIADGSTGIVAGVVGVVVGMILSRVVGVVPGPSWLGRQHVWGAVAVGFLLAMPFVSSGGFRTDQLATAVTWSLIVVSLNLLSGYAGQVSFAHSAFVGVGAYAVAAMIDSAGANILIATLVAVVIAASAGVLVGVPAVRLSGPYLAIATAGLAIVFPDIIRLQELSSVVGGPSGLSLFQHEFGPPVHWSWLTTDRWYYFLALISLGAGSLLVFNLVNSAAGRAMQALSESELAATACGISVPLAKVSAFSISAAMAGFSGVFIFILTNRSVSPDAFDVFLGVNFMVAMILGGLSSIPGSVLGAFIFIFFYREGLSTITSETEDGTNKWLFIGSLGVMSVLVFGSTTVKLLAARFEEAWSWKFARLVTTLLKLGLAVSLAVLIVIAYRQGEGELFNATRLRNGITGLSLVLFILFLPKGLMGLLRDFSGLTWTAIAQGVRRYILVDPTDQPSDSALVSESPGREAIG